MKRLFCITNNINEHFNSQEYQAILKKSSYICDTKPFNMSYEAGSKECRHLIEAKENLLSAMESLSNISSTDPLQIQIKDIYKKLEIMHDKRKKLESTSNSL